MVKHVKYKSTQNIKHVKIRKNLSKAKREGTQEHAI